MIKSWNLISWLIIFSLHLFSCDVSESNVSPENLDQKHLAIPGKVELVEKYLIKETGLVIPKSKMVAFVVPESGCKSCVSGIHDFLFSKAQSLNLLPLKLILINQLPKGISPYYFEEIPAECKVFVDRKDKFMRYGINPYFPSVVFSIDYHVTNLVVVNAKNFNETISSVDKFFLLN